MALACAVAALALVASACSGSDDDAASETTTTEATSTTVDAAAMDARFAEVAARIDSFVQVKGLEGATLEVVDRDAGVVWSYSAGSFTPDRISLLASASKMITAGVLLHLEDEGLLDLDEPIADYVPWAAGANPTITAAQLISNSSGLPGLLDGPTYSPYICQYVASGDIEDCGKQIFTTTEDDADVIPPDTEFHYGGGQWQVAGAVAETVSGRSWAELIDEIYVQPCGLGTLAYNNHYTQMTSPDGPFSYPTQFAGDPSTLKPTDNPNMEGGGYTTPDDYAQLLLMHLRDGRCGDHQVLSKAAVERAHQDRVGPAYGGTGKQPDSGYGLGWWVEDDPSTIQDGGAFGTVPWLDLDREYGAVLVIEKTSNVGRELAAELKPLVDEIIDELHAGG